MKSEYWGVLTAVILGGVIAFFGIRAEAKQEWHVDKCETYRVQTYKSIQAYHLCRIARSLESIDKSLKTEEQRRQESIDAWVRK